MDDVIEPARTGRARCRGCGEKISKDELRFGEKVPNPFSDDADAETTHWFHPTCGADKRPDKFAAALANFPGNVPDGAVLSRTAQLGIANPKLARVVRAEHSPSGRARCRQCGELIEKAALRIAIEVDADPMNVASEYFVHASCAPEKVGREGLLEKLERISAKLTAADVEKLRELLSAEDPPPGAGYGAARE